MPKLFAGTIAEVRGEQSSKQSPPCNASREPKLLDIQRCMQRTSIYIFLPRALLTAIPLHGQNIALGAGLEGNSEYNPDASNDGWSNRKFAFRYCT
jgi:hypothetical protein